MQAYHERFVFPGTVRLRAHRTHGLDFLAHWHEEAELIFITRGTLRLGINNQLLTLMAGQIAIVAPLDIHYYEKSGEADGYMLIFAPEFLDRQLPGFSGRWQVGDAVRQAELSGLAGSLVREMSERQPYFELAAAGLLRLFCSGFLRPDPAILQEAVGTAQSGGFRVLRDILDYLENHFRETLTRADLAAHFNLSTAHFSRLFKAATGMPLMAYLTRLRLESARQELDQTSHPILAIALDNGFDSIRTFNRVFRKACRQTPTAFREQQQGVKQ